MDKNIDIKKLVLIISVSVMDVYLDDRQTEFTATLEHARGCAFVSEQDFREWLEKVYLRLPGSMGEGSFAMSIEETRNPDGSKNWYVGFKQQNAFPAIELTAGTVGRVVKYDPVSLDWMRTVKKENEEKEYVECRE